MNFRRFQPADAALVAALVARVSTTTTCNNNAHELTPEWVIDQAQHTHCYVGVTNSGITACGAIGAYPGKSDEARLFDLIVTPEMQGQGVKSQLMTTLLHDPLAEYACRIEISASLTAVDFYQQFGFIRKGGLEPDANQRVRLERWCPFCRLPDQRIVDQNDLALAFEDRSPVSPGHLLVIPKRHCHDFFALTPDELIAIQDLLQRGKARLDQTSHPDGYNVGFNVNTAGGQSVLHAHCHLIPRWSGDVAHARGGIRQILGDD